MKKKSSLSTTALVRYYRFWRSKGARHAQASFEQEAAIIRNRKSHSVAQDTSMVKKVDEEVRR
jgi:hypothetical protein